MKQFLAVLGVLAVLLFIAVSGSFKSLIVGQITDSMLPLLKQQPFHAVQYEGRSFDCGSKLGFLKANIAFALKRDDLRDTLSAEIKKLL